MSVVVVRRWLFLCAAILSLCGAALVSLADEAADLARAQELFAAGQYAAAIPALVPLTASADKDVSAKALRMLGLSYQNTGEYSKAIKTFQKLITNFPNATALDSQVKQWILDCLLSSSHYNKASAYMETLLKDYPKEESTIHYVAGLRYRLQKKFPMAIEELRQAIQLKTVPDAEPPAPDEEPPAREMQQLLLDCFIAQGYQKKARALEEQLLKQYPREVSQTHFVAGRGYLMRRKFARAAKELEQALQLKAPSDAEPPIKLLQEKLLDCYVAGGDQKKAAPLMAQLLKQYPEDACQIHYMVGARYHTRAKYADAAGELGQAWELSARPGTGVDVRDMGQRLLESYFASGARDKGTALLSDLAARYPKDAVELYFIAGRAFQSRDQFDDAIGFFKKAAELAPPAAGKDRVGAKLLDCYLSKNDADAAQKLLDQLSRDHPNRAAYLHRVIGERYQTQRKLPEAVAAFKKSLELTIGSHSSAHYRVAKRDNEQLVTHYQSMGSFGEMEKQIQSMIATYPDASGGWKSNLGRFYVDSGAYEKAIPVLTEVIGNYPNCASGALVLLVEASSRLGKGEEALAQLKDYYKDKPELKAEFLQTYGRSLLMGTRDYSKSADVLKQFISEYPDSPQLPSARKLLASALEMAGRTDEAVEALKSSLPGNATPKQKAENWRRLATIYYKAKRWREALKAYKEVRTLKDAPDEMKAEATYRSGLCYREIDYDNSARRCMQEVARRYGETRWASRAEERLQMWSYVEQHY